MRESCSCGAGIHTIFYKRALTWRLTHLHSETEVHDLDSQTELSLPVGFHANPAEEEDEEC